MPKPTIPVTYVAVGSGRWGKGETMAKAIAEIKKQFGEVIYHGRSHFGVYAVESALADVRVDGLGRLHWVSPPGASLDDRGFAPMRHIGDFRYVNGKRVREAGKVVP